MMDASAIYYSQNGAPFIIHIESSRRYFVEEKIGRININVICHVDVLPNCVVGTISSGIPFVGSRSFSRAL